MGLACAPFLRSGRGMKWNLEMKEVVMVIGFTLPNMSLIRIYE